MKAIEECAASFRGALQQEWLTVTTLVPVPPSKANSDPEYDDRILKILEEIQRGSHIDCDIRELIVQRRSYDSSHVGVRAKPGMLKRLYRLAQDLLRPTPRQIALVDDVITTGAHFRAAKDLIQAQWPDMSVVGLFVARAVWLDSKGI